MNKWLWLVCLIALPVQAKDLTVTWEHPTQRVDSTPLPVSGNSDYSGRVGNLA